MKKTILSIFLISLTQANSLSGIIYASQEGSSIADAIIFATYSKDNDTSFVTGTSGPDGNY